MKRRLFFPEGLRADEKSGLKEALEKLAKVPKLARKETLRVSLPSTMSPAEREKLVEAMLKPVRAASLAVMYDSVVEETTELVTEQVVTETETVS